MSDDIELKRAYFLLGKGTWGDITGDITKQRDLQEELEGLKTEMGDHTVNGHKVSEDPVLDGSDVKLTGYEKVPDGEGVLTYSQDHIVEPGHTVDKAVGLLEYRILKDEENLGRKNHDILVTLGEENERAKEEEARLQKGIDAERGRAKRAEQGLQSGIDAEKDRAYNAEKGLSERIDGANESNEAALQEEIRRAKLRENELVSQLAEEKVRAMLAERELADVLTWIDI